LARKAPRSPSILRRRQLKLFRHAGRSWCRLLSARQHPGCTVEQRVSRGSPAHLELGAVVSAVQQGLDRVAWQVPRHSPRVPAAQRCPTQGHGELLRVGRQGHVLQEDEVGSSARPVPDRQGRMFRPALAECRVQGHSPRSRTITGVWPETAGNGTEDVLRSRRRLKSYEGRW